MTEVIKNLIEEHSQLIVRLRNLNDEVYSSSEISSECKGEFANKCLQLAGMRQYELALRARLYNLGINFDDAHNTYTEKVATINVVKPGSDFDEDRKRKRHHHKK